MTVFDNRTGRSYEIEVSDGTIKATALAQIQDMQGVTTKSFDPGYMNTINCISRVSFIDGDKGILEYRGIPIVQLAHNSTHLESSFLLIYGQLPTKEQLINFESRIRSAYSFENNLMPFIKSY